MSDLVDRARNFATTAHRRIDQRRKYSNQPYDTHLHAVAKIVAEVSEDEETIAAAWLHDTLEDTPATYEDIEETFGTNVATIVAQLTDSSLPSDGNRAVRKAIDRARLARAGPQAKTVKLADLIDNCRDIVGHDPRFGRVFVTEAALLVEVLEGGEPRLLTRAKKILRESAKRLGLPELPSPGLTIGAEVVEAPGGRAVLPARVMQMFATAFRASDIVEPLRSFDSTRSPADLARLMTDIGIHVAGIRIDGVVMGYVTLEDLKDEEGGQLRAFAQDQVIDGDATLSDAIHVLNLHDHCFVTLLGDVVGVITRAELLKPVVRMWLFGIVTFVEMEITERIRALWPNGEWADLISAARLRKARELHEERLKRGQRCELLDCLQYADKAQILMEDPASMAWFGFKTKGTARRIAKETESLRNHLAHSQDIVAHDWAQIVRMTRRLEEVIRGEA